MNRSALTEIERSVQTTLEKHFNKPQNLQLVLGVSGGPDSVALLRIAHKLGMALHAVHINYGMRGDDSRADQRWVEELCGTLAIPCRTVELDPQNIKGNFQEWAREQRLSVLIEEQKTRNADAIALGHHLDDQLETILMKILRGAGPDRLQGMSVWEGTFLRPLLDIPKDEILAYLEQIDQPYRIDKSNKKTDYARNLLRHGLMHKMDAKLPGWRENLLRVQEFSRSENELLHSVLGHIADLEEKMLKRTALLEYSRTTQASLLLKFIEVGFGRAYRDSLERSHLLELIGNLQELQTGKQLRLTDQLNLIRDRDNFILRSGHTDGSNRIFQKLAETDLQEAEYRLGNTYVVSVKTELPASPKDMEGLVMDATKLSWPVTLRNWRSGDRIQPLGMEGSQSVADHLANNKVSAHQKNESLVLEGFDRTIYAVIFPANSNKVGTISQLVRCDDTTSRYFIINKA